MVKFHKTRVFRRTLILGCITWLVYVYVRAPTVSTDVDQPIDVLAVWKEFYDVTDTPATRHDTRRRHVTAATSTRDTRRHHVTGHEMELYKRQFHWFSDTVYPSSADNVRKSLFLDITYDRRLRDGTAPAGKTSIKTVIVSNYKVSTLSLYAVASYAENVTVTCSCTVHELTYYMRVVNEVRHYTTAVSCDVPDHAPASEPLYVTLTHDAAQQATNLVQPTFVLDAMTSERLADIEKKARISVCDSSYFGDVELRDVHMFVNRMEALRMFGVSHVTLNHMQSPYTRPALDVASHRPKSRYGHPLLDQAFHYYSQLGVLRVKHLQPPVMAYYSHVNDNVAVTLLVMLLTQCNHEAIVDGDWLQLVLDRDDLLVPQDGSPTYQHFLRKLTSRDARSHAYAQFSVLSRSYYTFYAPDERQPRHMPLLRYNQHGYGDVRPQKSIRRPHACVRSIPQLCTALRTFTREKALNVTQLVNYHYCASCQDHATTNCTQEGTDRYFSATYGEELRERVKAVLTRLYSNNVHTDKTLP